MEFEKVNLDYSPFNYDPDDKINGVNEARNTREWG